jgi:hypothetical protein
VLRSWCLPDGTRARDVQDLCTGEVMTILDSIPKNANCLPGCTSGSCVASAPVAGASSVYHWGNSHNRPTGVPLAPGSDNVIVTAPKSSSESGGILNRWFGEREKVVQAPVMTEQPKQEQSAVPPRPKLDQTAVLPAVNPTSVPSAAPAPAPKMIQNPFASAMHAPAATPAPVKHPENASGCAKSGVAPSDASCTKPAQPGDTCCAKSSSPVGIATAAANKPFQGVAGTYTSPNKSLVKSVDQAQPTDWRRSWGKPDNWPAQQTQTAQVPATKPTQNQSTVQTLPPPRPTQESATASAPAKSTQSATAPATGTAVAQAAPPPPQWPATPTPPTPPPAPTPPPPPAQTVKVELPHANTKQPDPLMKPEERAQVVLDKKVPGLKAADAKPADAKPADAKRAPTPPAAVAKPAPETATAAAPSNQPRVPLGAGSVLAAYANNPGGVIYLPVPVVTLPAATAPRQLPPPPHAPAIKPGDEQANAFSPVKSTPGSDVYANAFGTESAPTEIINSPNAMSPAQAQMQMAMSAPLPSNALSAGYAYRAPSQMYQGPMPPSPIMQANYAPNGMMPGYPRPPYPPGYGPVMPAYCPPAVPSGPYYPAAMPAAAAPAPSAAISSQNVQQLMLTMKDALYPSHREWAAEALEHVDWRTNPQVVDALLVTAKADPAATVRCGAVRALAHMKINTTNVVATLQTLKSDTDPRVRQDVEQALTGLGNPSAVQSAGGIVPVGAK